MFKWVATICLAPASGLSTIAATVVGAVITKKINDTIHEHTPIGSLSKSFVDNVIREKVKPKKGSIIHCSLYGLEHTGIYVGNGEIVELQGNGQIKKTTPEGFTENTNAMSIYVACANGVAIGSPDIAERARLNIGRERNYNFLIDNCHQFTSGCVSGNFENANNYFVLVESEISNRLNNGESIIWHVCDFS